MRGLGVAVVVLAAGSVLAADQNLRVFKLHYRPAHDAASVVEPLLSSEGSVLLQPGLNAITVRDAPAVLERVAQALAAWDVAPQTYTLHIRVFLASRETRAPAPTPTPVPDLGERFFQLFPYTSYEEVASFRVTAADGSRVETAGSDRYLLRFVVRGVPQSPERVQLAGLELMRREQGAGGDEVLKPLVHSTVTLLLKQHSVIGSARSEGANRAVFLVFFAERAGKP